MVSAAPAAVVATAAAAARPSAGPGHRAGLASTDAGPQAAGPVALDVLVVRVAVRAAARADLRSRSSCAAAPSQAHRLRQGRREVPDRAVRAVGPTVQMVRQARPRTTPASTRATAPSESIGIPLTRNAARLGRRFSLGGAREGRARRERASARPRLSLARPILACALRRRSPVVAVGTTASAVARTCGRRLTEATTTATAAEAATTAAVATTTAAAAAESATAAAAAAEATTATAAAAVSTAAAAVSTAAAAVSTTAAAVSAAATATAAESAAATAAAESAATTAAAALTTLRRFVHPERATADDVAVHALDGFLRELVRRHGDEREPARAASLTVRDDMHVRDLSDALECRTNRIPICLERQIAHVQSIPHRRSLNSLPRGPRIRPVPTHVSTAGSFEVATRRG